MDEADERFELSPAEPGSAGEIAGLLERCGDEPSLYLRSREDIGACIRGFVVARSPDGRLAGCAAFTRHADGSHELVSVCVLAESRGRGLGSRLVAACERAAAGAGARELWLATARPGFFRSLGYAPFSAAGLPASLLALKALKVFTQPMRRWPRLLLTGYVYMRKDIVPRPA